MTGTSSPTQPPRRHPLSSLTPRGRIVLAVGTAAVLTLGVVVAAPGANRGAEPSGLASADAEREVVTADVAVAVDLAAVRTRLAVTGASRATSAAAPTHVVSAPASSRPVLRPGTQGPAVAVLQKKLGVKPTGLYGPMTFAAVVAFQKKHGLPAQGYVGPATWRTLLAPAAKPRAKVPAVRTAAARSAAPVTAGRVCPAPGASFGQGWGAPRAGHSHKGMDLVARRGAPILAVEDGVVIREGRQSNGALRIVLQGRSGSKFYYGHMSRDLVHAGSRVKRGQVIGLMGDTGSPGQVHLHFEYWRSGGESAAVDPAPLLRKIC